VSWRINPSRAPLSSKRFLLDEAAASGIAAKERFTDGGLCYGSMLAIVRGLSGVIILAEIRFW
jgi:hypothetical protein